MYQREFNEFSYHTFLINTTVLIVFDMKCRCECECIASVSSLSIDIKYLLSFVLVCLRIIEEITNVFFFSYSIPGLVFCYLSSNNVGEKSKLLKKL